MGRSRRSVEMVQIIGLDARGDESAHQRGERFLVIVHAFEQHRLAQHRNAGVDQPGASRDGLRRELARVVGVKRDVDRFSRALQRANERAVIRSGATAGTRVCQRITWR